MKTSSLFISLYLMVFIGMAQMPAAITIEPPFATAYDTLTLIFDPAEACIQSGSLAGLDSIAIHSGVTYQDGPSWQCVIDFDGNGLNGQSTTLHPTGDGRFSITYVPYEFYGFPNGAVVTEICAVFNNGTNWDQDGRNFEDEFTCMDFFIPIAHSCLPQGIIFTTQEQIDNFQIDHPYCTEVEGNVTISGQDIITNLNGLIVLTSISGELSIGDCDALQILDGLNNIVSLGGLEIIYNNNLYSLSGFENLTAIEGTLVINGNNTLDDLSGLDNLTTIGSSLVIGGSDPIGAGGSTLTSLNGLNSLTSIGGGLGILCNPNLPNLAGLESLSSVGGFINVGVSNSFLNDSLKSLEGLDNIDPGSITSLNILYNPMLSNCDVQSICDYLVSPNGSVEIHDNAPGCNSIEEVEVACSSCLPQGITFTTQEQIDNFQIDHPYCTEIEGEVTIHGANISNLYGLDVLTSFGHDLNIWNNPILINLSGLENVDSIGGRLMINNNSLLLNLTGLDNISFIAYDFSLSSNNSLTSLTGLENITSLGSLTIGNYDDEGNPSLTSLTGLDNLSNVTGYVEILGNNSLTNLTGLDNLVSIGYGLYIEENLTLENLTGLDNLTNIGGELVISNNLLLTNIVALDHVIPIDGYLSIYNNITLSTCEVQSICDYLVSPNGEIEIHGNAIGCNSVEEVEDACSTCLPEGITFETQAQIDSFQIMYPNCSEIEGDVNIRGVDITNLNGLSVLTSIGGDLIIGYDNYAVNPELTNLVGLEGLTSIGRHLRIEGNSALTSLTGLNNLTTIGGGLLIGGESAPGNPALTSITALENLTTIGHGGISIMDNNALLSLTGLDNVTSIGGALGIAGNHTITNLTGLNNVYSIDGSLWISGNNSLNSLTGMENIDGGSISRVSIKGNNLLSTCEVQSVCDYLVAPNGEIEIHDNASGCNSQEEVEEACNSSISENSRLYGIKTQPNPFSISTTIKYELKQPEKVTLTIYDYLGKQVYQTQEIQSQGSQQLIWKAEGYADGVYYYRLRVGDAVANGKMVKVR